MYVQEICFVILPTPPPSLSYLSPTEQCRAFNKYLWI
jgi:hypothetical protein